ncbi:hypothetical protein N0V90_008504 [Kalmusia sp. IMI 367209]|nr:hypothetical protein N0V90_008504 [Kalmusia sp. IMI 367209]
MAPFPTNFEAHCAIQLPSRLSQSTIHFAPSPAQPSDIEYIASLIFQFSVFLAFITIFAIFNNLLIIVYSQDGAYGVEVGGDGMFDFYENEYDEGLVDEGPPPPYEMSDALPRFKLRPTSDRAIM